MNYIIIWKFWGLWNVAFSATLNAEDDSPYQPHLELAWWEVGQLTGGN